MHAENRPWATVQPCVCNVYVYVYAYVCMHACIYIPMYLCTSVLRRNVPIYCCMYLSIYPSIFLSMHVSTYLCIYASMHLCTYTSTYLCIYIYKSMSLCLYIYVCIYINICILVNMYATISKITFRIRKGLSRICMGVIFHWARIKGPTKTIRNKTLDLRVLSFFSMAQNQAIQTKFSR